MTPVATELRRAPKIAVLADDERVVLCWTDDHRCVVILEGLAATAWSALVSGGRAEAVRVVAERWGASAELAAAWVEQIADELLARGVVERRTAAT